MSWFILVEASAEAVSQVLVIVICGVILSRTGYLSNSSQKSISQLNLYFMTPCLLFTKIASTINWEQFKAFWPIPVFFLIFSGVSWLIARYGSKFLRFSSDEEKFVKASVIFCNTNSLPMALVQSLAVSAAGSRLLRDENDTMEQVAARGISYILFYAIFGNLLRWSYGFSLLVPRDSNEQEQSVTIYDSQSSSDSPIESFESNDQILIDMNQPRKPSTGHHVTMGSESSVRTLIDPQDIGTSHSDQRSNDDSANGMDDRNYTGSLGLSHSPLNQLSSSIVRTAGTRSGPSYRRRHSRNRRESAKTRIRQTTSKVFKRIRGVLTPPLLTAILALLVGLVPSLHNFFISPESKFYSFIVRPLERCGEAAIPMILLCLGAQVLHFTSSSSSLENHSQYNPLGHNLPRRRRSVITPSIFPNPTNDSDSSSSDSDTQDHDWLQVQVSSRRNSQNLTQPREFPSPTEYNGYSSDDEITIGGSAFNGASELGLRAHRFRWLGPVPFVLLSRMVLVPLICLPPILFHPSTLSPILTSDPMFSLALVLISASPTAINMIQLCQIKGFFEKDMAGVLFWSYCILGIPCILAWSLVGLWAAGRY